MTAAVAVAAGPAVTVELTLAMDGGVRSGRPAEARVRLHAVRASAVQLQLLGAAPAVHMDIALDAGAPTELAIPLALATDAALEVRVSIDSRVVGHARLWPTRVSGARDAVVAVAAATAPEMPASVTAVAVPAAALPRTAAGYGAVSAVVLDGAALARLDLRQQQALEAFLAVCGRVLVHGLPGAAAAALRDGAGCAGAHFAAVPGPGMASSVLPALLARDQRPGPAVADLEQLAGADASGEGLNVALFLVAYAGTAVLVAWLAPSAWAVLVPVAASLLALALWLGAPPGGGVVLWLEQDAPGTARGTALAQLQGRGTGTLSMPLPAGLLPSADPSAAGIVIRTRGQDPAAVTQRAVLEIPLRLQSRARLKFDGAMPLDAPLTLAIEAGQPVLRNHGAEPIDDALLLWRGRAWPVPALAPRSRWSPAPVAAAEAADRPAARLALRRIAHDGVALLMPWEVPAAAGLTATGWLLLHAAGVADGG